MQQSSCEQLGMTDLYAGELEEAESNRDNNFLFGCKPSMMNQMKSGYQRRFGGETSSEEDLN